MWHDKKIGESAEDYFGNFLKKNGLNVKKNNNTKVSELSKFDLTGTYKELSFTFEVKFDKMATRTGNIAVEYFNPKSNKPSGIYVTTADFWIYVLEADLENEIWMTDVTSFKYFLANSKPCRIIDKGGDGNSSMMIFKKDKILPHFIQVNLLSVPQFLQILTLYNNFNK